MNRLTKVLNSIYSKRGRIFTALVVILLIPAFQNCGGSKFTSGSASFSSSSGLNDQGTGGLGGDNGSDGGLPTTPDPTAPVGGGSGSGLTLAQTQAKCKTFVSKPTISSLSATAVTAKSGYGTRESGDVNADNVTITAGRGITNPAGFAEYGCVTQFAMNTRCEIMSTPEYPVAVTNAYDMNGNPQVGSKTPLELAQGSLMMTNCQAAFNANASTAVISIRPNPGNNGFRCVQGSYTIKVTVENQIAALGRNVSEPKYLKVTMNNGCWQESRLKDSAGNIEAVANFGTVVGMGAGWAAVVAPTADASSSVIDVGAVYMYKLEGSSWIQKQKVMIANSASRESLGALAIRGDIMVIGSPYREGRGAIYMYARASNDQWQLVREMSPSDAQADQRFGQAVALNAGQIFVGSPNYAPSTSLTKAGAVSIYNYNSSGLTFVKKIDGTVVGAALGAALAADGDVLAVGAPQAAGKEVNGAGAVYMYSAATSWSQTSKIDGKVLAEKFGATVSLYGNKLAVGSPNFSANNKLNCGRVTYFENYAAAATKTWDGATAGDALGQGLALSNTGIYMGSPYSNGRAGRVDHFKYADLVNVYYRLVAFNGSDNNAFGWSVSTNGTDVVIGARIKNDPNDNSGAAYIYRYK